MPREIRKSLTANKRGPSNRKATSKKAAAKSSYFSGKQKRFVAETLYKMQDVGLIRDEIEEITGLKTNSVHPRVWEMVKEGYAEERGTRMTEGGNPADIVFLSPKGIEEIEKLL